MIDVSSQAMNSAMRWSAQTIPNIAAANSVIRPGESGLPRRDVCEVPDGVDAHEQADARHEQRHHERERVEAQIQVEVEVADPAERLELAVPPDAWPVSSSTLGSPTTLGQCVAAHTTVASGASARNEERPAPEPVAGQQDRAADQQVEEEQQEHGGRSSPRYGLMVPPTVFPADTSANFGGSYRAVTNVKA